MARNIAISLGNRAVLSEPTIRGLGLLLLGIGGRVGGQKAGGSTFGIVRLWSVCDLAVLKVSTVLVQSSPVF